MSEDVAVLSNDELEERLRTQAAHLAAGECRLLELLGEFDRREAWGAWGIRSAAHWLNWSCGTSLGTAREQLRVARALGRLPALRAAFGAGEISYSKVRAVTRVANPVLEDSLLALARQMTASQLEATVRNYRRADPEEARAALARHDARWFSSVTDDDGMVRISARLAPEEAEGARRQIPDTMRRAVLARDGGCRWPGCTRRSFLHLHHVRFVSRGGRTRVSNLVTTCQFHHRLVHEGGFRLAMSKAGVVRVWTPEGREVAAVPAPAPTGDISLEALHDAEGRDIDAERLTFNGERFDMGLVVEALLFEAGHHDGALPPDYRYDDPEDDVGYGDWWPDT